MRNALAGSALTLVVLLSPSARAADLPVAPPPRPVGYVAPLPRPAGSTGAGAKRALIDLMETRQNGLVSQPDIKKFGDVAAEPNPHNLGEAWWGPFTLDLAEMKYRFETG